MIVVCCEWVVIFWIGSIDCYGVDNGGEFDVVDVDVFV